MTSPPNATTPTRHTLRHRAHLLLHNPTQKNEGTKWLNRFLAFLIIANVIAVAIETVDSLHRGYEAWFVAFEAVSTVIFLIEYLVRMWCSVEQREYSQPVSGRVRWALRPVAVLDLLVIVSYFSPLDLRFLRLLRLLRLLSVLNLDALAKTYEHLKTSIGRRRDLLVLSAILMLFALFTSAALLYLCEHKAQPVAFSSIPATLWWSIETLTTIGYGDVYPITVAGKICTAFIAIFGIGIFALPTAILTGAVIEASDKNDKGMSEARAGKHVCPHCGKPMQ